MLESAQVMPHVDPLSSFQQDGFIVIDLDVDRFDRVAQKITARLRPKFGSGHRIENAWRISDDVKNLALLPQVLETLEKIWGRTPFPFQTLNFDHGTEQATHSDTIHFDSDPAGFMAGVWIALEDVDYANGPVRLFPGSHSLPQMTLTDFVNGPVTGDPYELYRTHYEPGIARIVSDAGLRPLEVHLRQGQALIWAANLLHGGQPILDAGRTRHSQVTHYYFERCNYHSPLLSGLTLHRRYPVDIRSGRNAGGEIEGAPVAVPMSQRLKSWAKTTLGRGTPHRH